MSYSISVASSLLTPPRLGVWEWARAHVDWSLDNTYRAALPGRFNADLMPFYAEPLAAFLDNTVKEIVMVKCSQCGASENLICMTARWAAATASKAILYVGGQQEQAEEFFLERIVKGMNVSAPTRALARAANQRGLVCDIGATRIAATWSKSGQGIKGRPFDWVFGDEVSSFPDVGVVDEMRKRLLTRPNGKLVLMSAPDAKQKRASAEDPIFIEYEATDQRQWFFFHGGEHFVPSLGTPETKHGIKWDARAMRDDGTWDLDAVAESAHYVTPNGQRLDERDRLPAMRAGAWRATNSKAPHFKAGFKITQSMVPFEGGSWGHLARRFLECNAKGPESRRVYFYETWADKVEETIEKTTDDELRARCAVHGKGALLSDFEPWKKTHADYARRVAITVDVQKNELYWLARLWWGNGDSALVEWGCTTLWDTIDAAVARYSADIVLVDNSFSGRKIEVERECAERGYIPIFGREVKDSRAIIQKKIDVNVRGAVVPIKSYTFNVDEFALQLMQMTRGEARERWYVYDNIEREYCYQLGAEVLQGGAFKKVRHRNHLLDCERYQILAAVLLGCASSSEGITEQP